MGAEEADLAALLAEVQSAPAVARVAVRGGLVAQAYDPSDQLLRHQPVPRPRGEGGVSAQRGVRSYLNF